MCAVIGVDKIVNEKMRTGRCKMQDVVAVVMRLMGLGQNFWGMCDYISMLNFFLNADHHMEASSPNTSSFVLGCNRLETVQQSKSKATVIVF